MKCLFSLSIFLFALFSNAQSLTSSLTACYDLNGAATDPVNGLTGTVSAATATVDRYNNPASALQFNGSTACFVQLPDNPLLKPSSAISFALWVKPESLAGGMHIIFTKNNQSSNFEAYQFEIFNGTFWRLNKANSSMNDIVLSTSTVVLNQWCHIACSIDNASLKLYVNGVLESSINSTFNGFDYQVGKNVYLGGTNEGFNHPFIGALDNLKFWNRVITQAEVTQLYNTDPSCIQGPAPIASFITPSGTICTGSPVTFTNTSINNPTSLSWILTGPSQMTSTIALPVFTFSAAGTYSIDLVAANGGGSSTVTHTIAVYPTPVLTLTPKTVTICNGEAIALQVAGADTFSWSTSQTGTLIQVSPSLTTVYKSFGFNNNGCSAMQSATVQVQKCTGIDNSGKANLHYFPNPARERIFIESLLSSDVIVNDITGRTVLQTFIDAGKLNEVDVSKLDPGIYSIWRDGDAPIRFVKDN